MSLRGPRDPPRSFLMYDGSHGNDPSPRPRKFAAAVSLPSCRVRCPKSVIEEPSLFHGKHLGCGTLTGPDLREGEAQRQRTLFTVHAHPHGDFLRSAEEGVMDKESNEVSDGRPRQDIGR